MQISAASIYQDKIPRLRKDQGTNRMFVYMALLASSFPDLTISFTKSLRFSLALLTTLSKSLKNLTIAEGTILEAGINDIATFTSPLNFEDCSQSINALNPFTFR